MHGTWSDPSLQYQGAVAAVTSRPGDAEAWYWLGVVCHDLKRWGVAAGCFARAVQINPEHKSLMNLGANLNLAGREEEAQAWLARAIDKEPTSAMACMNLSVVCGALGMGEDAIVEARRAVEYGPEYPLNHLALASALMMDGQWKEGFLEWEHRFAHKIPEFLTRPYPLWRGERVGHLLIEAEQGLGDAVMMLRYVPEASRRAERVTLFVHREVYALLERCEIPENGRALPLPQPLPAECDAWCPMFSLPVALEVEGPEEIGPYIRSATS